MWLVILGSFVVVALSDPLANSWCLVLFRLLVMILGNFPLLALFQAVAQKLFEIGALALRG
jgi:hypothetical protein